MIKTKILLVTVIAILLTGCIQTGRYQMKNDKAPLRKPTTLEMKSPTPKYEPIYPWSIKPYTVKGKHYTPLKSAKGYQAQGIASWYGRKFHGHTTANGETYDMFAMTAAHKTLPIPSYVRVTNIANNKSIIVRVNDRGPFHPKRVIDLSYSAAYALDILKHGVGEVKVEAIVVDKHQIPLKLNNTEAITQPTTQPQTEQRAQLKPTNKQTDKQKVELNTASSVKPTDIVQAAPIKTDNINQQRQRFVQVLASRDSARLKTVGEQLSAKYKQNHHVIADKEIYKLRLGPLQSEPQAQALIEALQNNGYHGAYMLYTKASLPHN